MSGLENTTWPMARARCQAEAKSSSGPHPDMDIDGMTQIPRLELHCEDAGKTFAIGARLDAPTQRAIAGIAESDWKQYADCAVAETLHSMNGTQKAADRRQIQVPGCSTTGRSIT